MSAPESPGSKLRESVTEASRQIEAIIDAAEQAAAEIRAQAQADVDAEAQQAREHGIAALGDVTAPLMQRIENLRIEASALTHEIEAAAARLRELTGTRLMGDVSAAPRAPETPAPTFTSVPQTPAAPEPTADKPQPSRTTPAFASKSTLGPRLPFGSGPKPIAYPGTSSAPAETPSQPSEAPDAPAPGAHTSAPEEALLRATQMAVAGSSRDEITQTLQSEFGMDDASPIVDDILGP